MVDPEEEGNTHEIPPNEPDVLITKFVIDTDEATAKMEEFHRAALALVETLEKLKALGIEVTMLDAKK